MLVTSSGNDIEIDRKQLCHYLGHGADCKPPAPILSLIGEYAEHAHHLIEPAYSYIIKNIEQVEGSMVFRSQVIHNCQGRREI